MPDLVEHGGVGISDRSYIYLRDSLDLSIEREFSHLIIPISKFKMKTSSVLTSLAFAASASASSFSPARPPHIPLSVKTPYMSTGLTVGSDGGDGGLLTGDWARHWQYVDSLKMNSFFPDRH